MLLLPLRRFAQNPRAILAPYVHEGQTVLEPGPGMGFFTLEAARLVGRSGRVVAVDIQPKMLERLKARANQAELLDRIDLRLATADSLNIPDLAASVDFTLAFAVVHELPDIERFFQDVATASKPGAQLLLAEPRGHVKEADFAAELELAAQAGFETESRPAISRSSTAVLRMKTHTAPNHAPPRSHS